MNIIATIILGFFSLLNFSLGYIVYKKNKNHLAFFSFSVTLAAWVLFYALSFTATNHTLLCTRLIVIPPIFFPLTFNWFCKTLYSTNKQFSTLEKTIHTLLITIQISTIHTSLFIKEATFINNSIHFTYGPVYILQGLYIAIGMSYGIYRLIKKYKVGTKLQKTQIQYISLGIFVGTLIGIIFSYLLPLLGLSEFNKFTTIASISILFFTNYAITKHRLMNISIIINKTTAWLITLSIFITSYILLHNIVSSTFTTNYILQLTLSTSYAIIMGLTFNKIRLFLQTTAEKKFLKNKHYLMGHLPEITRAFSSCYNLESFEKIAKDCFKNILEISGMRIFIDSKFYQNKIPANIFTELNFSKESHQKISYNHPLITLLNHTQNIIIKTELQETDQNLLSEFNFILCIPCFNEDQLSAFFMLDSKYSEDVYTYDNFKFLEIISSQMAIILERIIPFEKVKKDYEKTREYAEKVSQQKAFTQLSMGIAHEIRNPMSNLLLRAEIVEKKCNDPEAVLKFSDMIKRNISRILRITNAMLKYGTPTSKERTKGDINTTIQETIDMVDTKCNQNNITIKTHLGYLQPLHYDEAALYQSFSNIILNAIDSMNENGGTLTITTTNARLKNDKDATINEGIMISIQDSGIGMDQETINKIYNPFYSTKYSHIGLGLCMALKSINAHKGTIDIQSEKEKGSIFNIFLPYIIKETQKKSQIPINASKAM